MNKITPWDAAGKAPVSALSEEIGPLVDHGLLPYLRPCAPPGVELLLRRGVKLSDGKLPSTYVGGRWVGMPAWREYQPKSTDVLEWSTWPGAGLCLVTGEICAFDIDIKFDSIDRTVDAVRGRQCIKEIGKVLAAHLDRAVTDLPVRGRENSTSCAIFVRLTSPVEKQVVTLFEVGSDRKHKVEFLASGQQIVIAGRHETGVRVKSTLSKYARDNIPTISPETLKTVMAEIAMIAQRCGYNTERKSPTIFQRATGKLKPELAVAREIMRRRAEWVPSLLPVAVGKIDQEWRISSGELERDLDEDLCIYPDGIFDHGTERSHTVVSFIREFGAFNGEMTFGGCPRYGRQGRAEFAVVGEYEPCPRRPTEGEALNWLCKQLAGANFPDLPPDAIWSTSWRAIAAAVGIDWRTLEALQFNVWFDEIGEDGIVRPFNPAEWSADDLKRNQHLVAAIRFVDPAWFARLEFSWDVTGASSPMALAETVESDAQRVREAAVSSGYEGLLSERSTLDRRTDFPEPIDIFGDDDPAELGAPPAGSLPLVIERWARSEARRKGVPLAFATSAAIGVTSSAIGSSLKICPRLNDDVWTEPAAMWLALVADPGSAKSPTISAAVDPLRKLDGERYKTDQAKHNEWLAASKKKGKDASDPGQEPKVRRSVVDDVTMERQVRIHADNPRGVLRAPDELLGLIGSLGAYKKGAEGDRSQVLRLFDGGAITIDRVGAGSIRAESALMGVIAGTQPEKLRSISRDLSNDGMLQRFLFVLHDGCERDGFDEAPDRDAIREYAALVRGLASAEYFFCPAIRMSADGHAAHSAAMAKISSLKFVPGAPAAWKGHIEKWGKFLPRLILTFHAIEEFSRHGSVDPEKRVELQTVQKAASFARFLLRHSLRFYETYFGASEAASEAREIAGYMLTKGAALSEVTRKTIYDARKDLRGPTNLPALLAAMAELENAGWCAVAERKADGPTRWTVNPKVHSRFDQRAIRERSDRASRQAFIVEAGKQRREWVNSDAGGETYAGLAQ